MARGEVRGTYAADTGVDPVGLDVDTPLPSQNLGLVRSEQQDLDLSFSILVRIRERLETDLQGLLLRDRVESPDKGIVGDGPNPADRLEGIMVIDDRIRSVLLDEIKVPLATSRNDLVPRELCQLNGKETDTCGSAVDEEPFVSLDFGGRVRNVQALVECLTGRSETDTVDGGFTESDLGRRSRDLPGSVARYTQVLYSRNDQRRGRDCFREGLPAKAPRSGNCPPWTIPAAKSPICHESSFKFLPRATTLPEKSHPSVALGLPQNSTCFQSADEGQLGRVDLRRV